MKYTTNQEGFWAGEFGDDYIHRNKSDKQLASSIAMYSKILSRTDKVNSVIEFGSNIGINLDAIQTILPRVELSAIEINANAIKELEKKQKIKVYHQSILDFQPDYQRDFVFSRGVLIHINPNYLNKVYELMYKTSNRYICVAEYYNPKPAFIEYRGEKDKLFKRDFAGEIMDIYKDVSLVDYGFIYHRDNNFPQDDICWFLLEKLR
ncbi:hypothetical protein K8O96_15085 [Clostridium sporogenes]|uniref:Pseudaminic acid biosynthesis-associated methylase n=1 Tax=Clostridium botulinum TaxID=1491 RepID=A0A6M0SWU7_CLOBO|nr:pseudaminic acid biosynthesis-associated methylase [Clostridium sporogenes]NFA59976.1 pseudaminic acid biosynthesis-associated methylase [Clostridium botulinum]NFI73704.1 pseudaminic acid biosynthesis-associated methylase [Clostridium sporogenes]NFL72198.1 pseudaminic acid biosynthesis-associated methylase [Clostridium sporogenes]NFM23884.1 pseudaminic acid biosynthesis-associated methylase [Clostridium sporogenes]NFP61578.1 pseudaminic acid biosynthesis-associated methylase [Clostridium sp